jgi:twitching motility protein PilT
LNNSLINIFLEYVVHHGGTDIHLCPGAIPYVRVNGALQALDVNTLTVKQIEDFISELLDSRQADELRQSRAISFTFAVSNLGRFRGSVYSQRGSFAMTIRAMPHEIPDIESLGLPSEIKTVMEKTRGLVLVVGAGSAKAATLACLVDIVNQKKSVHISTVENPIEYLHRHRKSLVTQKEIGGDTADFQTGLNRAVCEDSDIIMLSEMPQEPEIILQILTAAEEKLVLVGLNAIGTTKAIEYIIDAFSSPTQKEAVTEKQAQVRSRLAGVLECILHQSPRRRESDAEAAPFCEMLILSTETKQFIADGKFNTLNSKLRK